MNLIIDHPIPTNVITGFLGAGKTTAIQALLRDKPTTERWAVLVNEFGDVGIDAGLLAGAGEGEVFIREVPGGCMCCAAGLPMQVALNQLISAAKPARLLIEPTGLGHPKEVVKVLQQPEYRAVLDLRAVITLVDARKIVDPRYAGHDTFRQQLEVADCIVANKQDLYEAEEVEGLRVFLDDMGLGETPLHVVSQGAVKPEWLAAAHPRSDVEAEAAACMAILEGGVHAVDESLPAEGFRCTTREQEGFFSVGWIFGKDFVFDHERLYLLLSGVDAERIKAVVLTNRGVVGFNMADGVLTSLPLAQADDSRVELITRHKPDCVQLERQLLDCVVDS